MCLLGGHQWISKSEAPTQPGQFSGVCLCAVCIAVRLSMPAGHWNVCGGSSMQLNRRNLVCVFFSCDMTPTLNLDSYTPRKCHQVPRLQCVFSCCMSCTNQERDVCNQLETLYFEILFSGKPLYFLRKPIQMIENEAIRIV